MDGISFSFLYHRMAKQVFESLDLVRHIYSFGPEHRTHLRQVNTEFKGVLLSTVHKRYPYRRADEERYYGATTSTMLREFYRLNRCRCCSRHSHNKPIVALTQTHLILRQPYTWVPECKDLFDCRCNCRFSCRTYVSMLRRRTHLPILG
jgi:hypothetical protein